jgi:8-oxo-dGTP pyrophosphatase MutT (NUDIX family)
MNSIVDILIAQNKLDSKLQNLIGEYLGYKRSVNFNLENCPEKSTNLIKGKLQNYEAIFIKEGDTLKSEINDLDVLKNFYHSANMSSKKHCVATIIRDIEDYNNIMLLLRSGEDSFHPNTWCLPGGGVDFGENIFEAARREIKEETNLKIFDIQFKELISLPEVNIYYFEAYINKNSQNIVLDNKEHKNYIFSSFEEWKNLPLILDLKSHLCQLMNINWQPTLEEFLGENGDIKKGGYPIGTVRNGFKKVADTGGKGDWIAVNHQEKPAVRESKKKDDSEDISAEVKEYEEKLPPKPTSEQTWKAYGLFCNMVVDGTTKSLVAFGTGGVGKTFTLESVLQKKGMVGYDEEQGHNINEPHNYDYIKITGSANGSSVYQALFEHNGKLIIFDDCDSALKDENAVNFFKGALDSSGDGTISYKPSSPLRTDKLEGSVTTPTGLNNVPSRFKFKGQVIFISNLAPDKIPQPLIDSRCLSVDLSMSKDETIKRIQNILPKMDIKDARGNSLGATLEEKQMALDFLNEHRNDIRIGKLNARTLGNIIKVIHSSKGEGEDWKDAAETLLFN